MWTSALLTAFAIVSFQQPVRPPYLTTHDVPFSKVGHPMNGQYRLTWDDKVDGRVEPNDKLARIKIHVVGEEVFGEFVGPIAGQNRKATIVGRVEGGADPTNLFTFRQREPGYTCSYQMTLGTGSFVGVWHDTKGRSGDFLLMKYQ